MKMIRKTTDLKARLLSAVMSLTIAGTALVGAVGVLPTSTTAEAATVDYGLASTSQKGVILHCWNWSYNNIKKYMKYIAAAGYTSVQTSPVQQPKDYFWEGVAYGNVGIPDGTGGYEGNWWKAYQPVTFNICNNGHTWYGTKAEFKAMCDEAEKYGVKVIVDIVANHMGNIKGYKIATKGDPVAKQQQDVMGDISPQVGEFWKPDMLTDPSYWHISTSWTHSSDGRFDVTQGNMGMPDLNTGDSKVQQMVLGLLKECIDCGADGFRFDAAKHIETPVETPADNSAFASSFWDVVLDGARSYYKTVNGTDGVFFYGEVLNRLDDTNAENYYLSKMSITDNSTSDNLRNSVINGSVSALASSGYCGYIHGKGDHCVLWAESHDTYMGGGSSYDANDSDIKKTWAIIASRKDSTGLFFARPYYSKDILAGDVSKARQSNATILSKIDEQTQLGDVGTLTWADPAVVAVNRFRNYFVGKSEKLGSSGNNAYNVRGGQGIVIVRGGGAGSISISGTGMADGTYYDQVTGEKFTVSGGKISGTVKNADGIAVVYNPSKDYGTVNPPEPTVLRISAKTANDSTTFTTDSTNVTISVTGAASTKYTTSEGASGTFTTASKTINVGKYTSTGKAVTVTVKATASDGTTKEKSYSFTKKIISSEYPTLSKGGVVFDNSGYKWADVYCYVYDDSGASVVNNGSWPGEKMSAEFGDYYSYEYPTKFTGNVKVIFTNNSGAQYPTGSGLVVSSSSKKLFANGALTDLPASVASLTVTLSAPAAAVPNSAVTLKATAKNGSGTVKYTFLCNDGTTIKASSTSNTATWTPTKEGKYIVAVNAKDDSLSVTEAVEINVSQSGTSITNVSTASAATIGLGDKVTFTFKAQGGTAPYQYKAFYKKSTDSSYSNFRSYSTSNTCVFKPTAKGTYKFLLRVKDSKDNIKDKAFTIKVTDPVVLTNTSTVSATSVDVGSKVTFKFSAKSGTAPYQFKVFYKKSTDSSYSNYKSYSTATSCSFEPTAVATYKFLVRVKDSAGTIKDKAFTITATKPKVLTNLSTLSAASIKLGSTFTVNCKAISGTTPYKYAVYYKKTTDSKFVTKQDFTTNKTVTIKPAAATQYTVVVKVKDGDLTIARKEFKVTVTK